MDNYTMSMVSVTDNNTNTMLMSTTLDPVSNLNPHPTVLFIGRLFRASLIPFICMGNGMTLISIFAYRRLKTYTNFFIGSLALTDF